MSARAHFVGTGRSGNIVIAGKVKRQGSFRVRGGRKVAGNAVVRSSSSSGAIEFNYVCHEGRSVTIRLSHDATPSRCSSNTMQFQHDAPGDVCDGLRFPSEPDDLAPRERACCSLHPTNHDSISLARGKGTLGTTSSCRCFCGTCLDLVRRAAVAFSSGSAAAERVDFGLGVGRAERVQSNSRIFELFEESACACGLATPQGCGGEEPDIHSDAWYFPGRAFGDPVSLPARRGSLCALTPWGDPRLGTGYLGEQFSRVLGCCRRFACPTIFRGKSRWFQRFDRCCRWGLRTSSRPTPSSRVGFQDGSMIATGLCP